jgi:hypothetical protein
MNASGCTRCRSAAVFTQDYVNPCKETSLRGMFAIWYLWPHLKRNMPMRSPPLKRARPATAEVPVADQGANAASLDLARSESPLSEART